jgi:hypothetical protein
VVCPTDDPTPDILDPIEDIEEKSIDVIDMTELITE